MISLFSVKPLGKPASAAKTALRKEKVLEKTQTTERIHDDLVAKHLDELEVIKHEAVEREHYEAADVIGKSACLIKAHQAVNNCLINENKALKMNARMYLAGLAMSGMLADNISNRSTIPKHAVQMADEILILINKK
jgi:hypothetical protein